jgi:MFS family permease
VALSVVVTLPWTGSILAFSILPLLAPVLGITGCFILTFVLMFSGVVILTSITVLEKRGLLVRPRPRSGQLAEGHSIKWADIKGFPTSFWLISLWQIAVPGTLWPFLALSPALFHAKWDFPADLAGLLAALFAFIPIVVSPLIGAAFGRFGCHLEAGMLACLVMTGAYLLLGWTDTNPFCGTILLSLVLATATPIVYPILAMVIDPRSLGTALGVATSLLNIGFVAMPFIFGYFFEQSGSFLISCSIFAVFGLLGFLAAAIARFFFPPKPFSTNSSHSL